MKFDELCFKVITGTYKRNLAIIEKLKTYVVVYPSDIEPIQFVAIGNRGSVGYIHDMERFDLVLRPEITFDEAIKMLDECESAEKKSTGKFVEYDIEPDGKFETEFTRIFWQDYTQEEDEQTIFCGWLFAVETKNESGKRWSIHRLGLDSDDRMVSAAHDWVKPLIPTKIRFWIKE